MLNHSEIGENMMNLKNKKIRINGNRIYLRKLDEKDATQEYCDWLNDPEVNKYLETREATIKGLRQYIKDKNKDPNCLFLGIFLKENEKHIVNIKLEPVDFKNKKVIFLGMLIGDKKYWGKGIGTDATKLLVNWAFDNLKLEEIKLGVLSENTAAIKVYTKAGFQLDTIEKKSKKIGNKVYILSIKRRKM